MVVVGIVLVTTESAPVVGTTSLPSHFTRAAADRRIAIIASTINGTASEQGHRDSKQRKGSNAAFHDWVLPGNDLLALDCVQLEVVHLIALVVSSNYLT